MQIHFLPLVFRLIVRHNGAVNLSSIPTTPRARGTVTTATGSGSVSTRCLLVLAVDGDLPTVKHATVASAQAIGCAFVRRRMRHDKVIDIVRYGRGEGHEIGGVIALVFLRRRRKHSEVFIRFQVISHGRWPW